MAWFGRGETLGKLPVKVRAGRVSTAYDGQQPWRRSGGPADRIGKCAAAQEVRGSNRYAER
ncbi:hypothetical protein GCM10023220_62410 [Streptomyces ziwulingensis]|uniref:Uncharacterized protein n=1 Tax=Streptomyces ziwulingensis TaxID=1045501 RepID=A0ABP9CW66_9ACTN